MRNVIVVIVLHRSKCCLLQALDIVYPIRVDSVSLLHRLWHSQVSVLFFCIRVGLSNRNYVF